MFEVGLLGFVHFFHQEQLFLSALETFLELALGLIAFTMLLLGLSQQFPHPSITEKVPVIVSRKLLHLVNKEGVVIFHLAGFLIGDYGVKGRTLSGSLRACCLFVVL